MARVVLVCIALITGWASVARAESIAPPQIPLPPRAEPPAAQPGISAPLHPAWAPVVTPLSMLAPGLGHTFRGDLRTGRHLLLTGGILLGTGLASASGVALTGAADVPSAVLAPLMVVSVSSFLVLGVADAVGAFSPPETMRTQDVFTDGWASRVRLGVGYDFVPDPALDQAHLMQVFGGGRVGRWKFGGGVGSTPSVDLLLADASAGFLVLPLDEAHGAGLWLLAGLRHERNTPGDFTLWGAGLEASAVIPLGELWPTLSRVAAEVHLGVRPWRAQYGIAGTGTTHLELTGGSEVRWTATGWLRPYAGYDHARDGLVGGQGVGFIGSFYGGAELRLMQGLWLDARGAVGTPDALRFSVERRW